MNANAPAAIEVIGLTKRYAQGKPAVDSINLRIASGSYCCLLGPSGCGKSTTLRMIAGHESASDGDILLENRNITDLPAAERGTAMMFQSYALFPHLSVLDNVAYGPRMQGLSRAARREKAMAGSLGSKSPELPVALLICSGLKATQTLRSSPFSWSLSTKNAPS